jgi:hypothetical protein
VICLVGHNPASSQDFVLQHDNKSSITLWVVQLGMAFVGSGDVSISRVPVGLDTFCMVQLPRAGTSSTSSSVGGIIVGGGVDGAVTCSYRLAVPSVSDAANLHMDMLLFKVMHVSNAAAAQKPGIAADQSKPEQLLYEVLWEACREVDTPQHASAQAGLLRGLWWEFDDGSYLRLRKDVGAVGGGAVQSSLNLLQSAMPGKFVQALTLHTHPLAPGARGVSLSHSAVMCLTRVAAREVDCQFATMMHDPNAAAAVRLPSAMTDAFGIRYEGKCCLFANVRFAALSIIILHCVTQSCLQDVHASSPAWSPFLSKW